MLMGYREYARHRGVALRAVQKAIESGRIVVTGEKKIDSDIADRDWDANTDASRVAVGVSKKKSIKSARAVAETAGDDNESEEDDTPDAPVDVGAAQYRLHRASREEYQALAAKLEYETAIGKMINADEARRIAFTSFRALRDVIMNVPARIKDQLAALTEAHECEALIEDELSAALSGIDIGKLLVDKDEDEQDE